jgi:methyltransferase (TIGR00027 family)
VSESADWSVANGVGFTALVVAAARAVESRREAPLLRDPYAEAFVLAAPLPSPVPTTPEAADSDTSFPWSMVNGYVAVRSRLIDEFLHEVFSDGEQADGEQADGAGIRQVVILAAGLDTRAFRLEWPAGMTVYEVDAPLVLSFKEQVLGDTGATARSGRNVVPADLRDDWSAALRGAGFDPARPTVWLAEGLLVYLPDEVKASLLATVEALSAPGSQAAIEHIASPRADLASNAAFREATRRADFDVDVDTLWDGGDYDPVRWLRATGWSVEVSPISAAARRYGRPLAATLPEGMLTALLVTAHKAGQPHS